ncbi:MAG: hypothetical protein DRN96_02255 [Thermoproteota archaeon]|nr:MAG: hypothetical protein DRN96_02255 [Candidatus Korarchaeota archaeon]RLG53046.1 MAG: hypothetical protein DRN99_07130 [Candidatus Korarchaeota archaeon]
MFEGLPRPRSLVVARVIEVDEYGAKVELLEYGGKQAYIPRSQVAPVRIRNIRDFVREGQIVVGRVLRVDEKREEIDLTLKFIRKDEAERKLGEWKRNRRGVTIMLEAARKIGRDKRKIMTLARRLLRSYTDVLAAIEEAIVKGADVLVKEGFDRELAEKIVELGLERVSIPTYESRFIIEARCYAPDGAVVLRRALTASLNEAKRKFREVELNFTNIGSPRYLLKARSHDPKQLRQAAELIVKLADEELRKHDGLCRLLEEERAK